jgi:hypothetical protein
MCSRQQIPGSDSVRHHAVGMRRAGAAQQQLLYRRWLRGKQCFRWVSWRFCQRPSYQLLVSWCTGDALGRAYLFFFPFDNTVIITALSLGGMRCHCPHSSRSSSSYVSSFLERDAVLLPLCPCHASLRRTRFIPFAKILNPKGLCPNSPAASGAVTTVLAAAGTKGSYTFTAGTTPQSFSIFCPVGSHCTSVRHVQVPFRSLNLHRCKHTIFSLFQIPPYYARCLTNFPCPVPP